MFDDLWTEEKLSEIVEKLSRVLIDLGFEQIVTREDNTVVLENTEVGVRLTLQVEDI